MMPALASLPHHGMECTNSAECPQDFKVIPTYYFNG